MSSKTFAAMSGVAALLAVTQVAGAHPGHGLQSGFVAGVAHPVSGIDHILAMIAVGLCAAQLGGRAIWILPLTFLTAMVAAGALAMNGAHVGMAEQGIAASVLILGLMVAMGSRMRLPVVAGLVALFAFFHGYAHGAEMTAGVAASTYAAGFVVATSGLLSIGLGLGVILKRQSLPMVARVAGGGIACVGVVLFWMV